jgi:site-specific DNA-cytosine methylase
MPRFQAPPLNPQGVVYDSPAWASKGAALLQQTPWDQPVRVASPCAGLNAPDRAARELRCPWESVDIFDINDCLRGALADLHPKAQLHCGRSQGDVTRYPLEDLSQADGLVSGPPCPPFSTIGKGAGAGDPRAAVFVRVMLWISSGARRGLQWFILENVDGILKRKKDQEESFASWFMRAMLEMLPDGWLIDCQQANSGSYGVPQSRPRVFFVGTSPHMRSSARQRKLLGLGPAAFQIADEVFLEDFLDKVAQPDDFEHLSVTQQLNVLMQLDTLAQEGSRHVGVVDAARDPCKPMDSAIAVNRTRTLRTNNSHLWILPATAAQRLVYGERGRLMNRAEKARMAGITPFSLGKLTTAALETAVGNTIPVPLIGAVLVPILAAWRVLKQRQHLERVSMTAVMPVADDGEDAQ